MVLALHAAGMEVILDVVYDHTAEGNHHRSDARLQGIENRGYYMADARGTLTRLLSGTRTTA